MKPDARVLVTGGAGFIGHRLVYHLLRDGCDVVSLDRLDVSGTLLRLRDVVREVERTAAGPPDASTDKARLTVVHHDLKAPLNDAVKRHIGGVSHVFHLAASTHVDRSIVEPSGFVMDNVVGTANLLDYARELPGLERFVYFSTDEVFGPAPDGVSYTEDDRHRAGNPYAATKAGAEQLCFAYANTYDVPAIVTRTMNVIGIRQHPEKFVPMTIRKVAQGRTVLIHADPGRTRPGSRFYVTAADVARALLRHVIPHAKTGEAYHIVGAREVDNLEIAQLVASHVGKPLHYELVDFHSSRPGHDLRYSMSGAKLASLGFEPLDINDRIGEIVRWYLDNPRWLGP